AAFRYGLNIDTGTALLITAQLAAWGFWIYFFLFCKRWNISPGLQICGALLIAAHPAAFFLIADYSESLFLMALLGFIYWSTAEGRYAKFWAAVHGIVMSATRIVGIVCAAFPLVCSIFQTGWRRLVEPKPWFRKEKPAIAVTLWQASAPWDFSLILNCAGVTGIFICSRRQPGGELLPIIWRCSGLLVIAGLFQHWMIRRRRAKCR